MTMLMQMIGSPLVQFILAITVFCLGMVMAVVFCCMLLRLGNVYNSRQKGIPWAMYDKNKGEILIHNSVQLKKHQAQDECCTIFVPEVGIVM